MGEAKIDNIESLLRELITKQNDNDVVLRDMGKTLTQLNQTVVGNPMYGQKGLVTEMYEIKSYVDKDRMVKNKLLGGLTVVGVLWTILFQYFMTMIKK